MNARLVAEDEKRVDAIRQMMIRHGFDQVEADVRATPFIWCSLAIPRCRSKKIGKTALRASPITCAPERALVRQKPNLPVFGRNSRTWIPLTNKESTEKIFG